MIQVKHVIRDADDLFEDAVNNALIGLQQGDVVVWNISYAMTGDETETGCITYGALITYSTDASDTTDQE